MKIKTVFFRSLLAASLLTSASIGLTHAQEQIANGGVPTLVITNAPLPEVFQEKGLYESTRVPDIRTQDVLNETYFAPRDTVASRKIEELRQELFNLQNTVANLSENLRRIEGQGQSRATSYYTNIATIRTQLQTGTTPGNPRLVERLKSAQNSLEDLSDHVSDLNNLAVQITDTASLTSFLEQATRATYGLSGAVEEDHVRLSQLEDAIANTQVIIERLLDNVNDNITRTAAYLSSERRNVRTLTTAIAKGDLFGSSLANRPFAELDTSAQDNNLSSSSSTRLTAPVSSSPSSRPLAVIKFDQANVNYEQAVFLAVSEALERYPQAQFEVVAVEPGQGNAALKAIESARSKRNADKVARTLSEFGIQGENIRLSSGNNPNSLHNEVHILIRL